MVQRERSLVRHGVTERCDANVDWSPAGNSVTFTLGKHSALVTADHGSMSDEPLDVLVRLIVEELIANQQGTI